jgi:hypothetical protein
VGDPLPWVGGPFDWMLCGPAGVAGMIESGCFFPETIAEFDSGAIDPQTVKKPHWPRFRCHFWHVKGPFAIAADRQAEKVRDFESLAFVPRKVFVISNLQNNLAKQRHQVGGFDFEFTGVDLARLHAALVKFFGAGVELHAITSWGRNPKLKPSDASMVQLHEFDRDRSQWAGDDGQWRSFFERIVQ